MSEIREIVEKHEEYRRNCLNLIASENTTSELVDFFYLSDFKHRYAIGKMGQRDYGGTRFVDEIERLATKLTRDVFNCKYVNLTPISGTMANLAAYVALLEKGNVIAVIPPSCGSHLSHNEIGVPGVYGLKTVFLPFDTRGWNIDLKRSKEAIEKFKPKLIIVGASEFLFPVPLKELREIAEDSIILYDAAHVLGLIAGKQFQDPLREGADLVTSSTHKTFFGPQGGIIFTNNSEIANKVEDVVFRIVANHHVHRIPALAVALLEMKTFGEEYAKQVIKNAKALGKNLHSRGFRVAAANKGFTESHQILIDLAEVMDSREAMNRLEEANIITNFTPLPWNNNEPTGLRLGTQEMTRYGMKEAEMGVVANLIQRTLIQREEPSKIRQDVVKLRRKFQRLRYAYTKEEAKIIKQK